MFNGLSSTPEPVALMAGDAKGASTVRPLTKKFQVPHCVKHCPRSVGSGPASRAGARYSGRTIPNSYTTLPFPTARNDADAFAENGLGKRSHRIRTGSPTLAK
jgi:hypothetical protein